MMTKKCNVSLKRLFSYILIFSLFLQSAFSGEEGVWTVGAEKFNFVKGQKENAVTEGVAVAIPENILENLNQTLNRNIKVDEQLERTRYDLRTKRQSLYLQLSSAYKKRDALFLSFSGQMLKKKLADQDKEINKIKKEIDDNLTELKNAEEDLKIKAGKESEASGNFFKTLITNEKTTFSSEKIKIYDGNPESLITVSDKARAMGYQGSLFEKEIYNKGVNALLTGNITSYDEYISVAVDLYLYPGGRKIGSVMEVGSLNDLELIASSIVSQIIPLMTNSMPVTLNFSFTPKEVEDNVEIYIDDVLQKKLSKKLTITTGVHSIRIVANEYKTLATNYYFEGNTKYNIQVDLQPVHEGQFFINLKTPLIGQVYANGILADSINDSRSKISINGNNVLGQFVSEDGLTDFFFVPENLYFDENAVSINPKPADRQKNIDKRRRWMYGAYSGFIVSLIPMFMTKGTFNNISKQYYDGKVDYQSAHKWEIATNVCTGITIGAAVFWGFELVRYFIAANSVLPKNARQADLIDFEENENNINNNDIVENPEKEDLDTNDGDNK